MSLIHDALKKAEQETNKGERTGPLPFNPIIPDQRFSLPNRTMILGIVLVISLGFLIIFRLSKKPASPAFLPQMAATLPNADPASLKKEALRLFQDNRLTEARSTMERLALLSPTDAEVYNNLGLLLKKLGEKEKARKAYSHALALNGNYPEALNNLGVLHLEEGETAKAKELFERAALLAPDYPPPHLHLGLIAEQEGNSDGLKTHYLRFLELSPNLDPATNQKISRKIKGEE